MLNQYVARERVADWRRLAASNQRVVSSRPEKHRPSRHWPASRPWRRTAVRQPVQA